jgi:hypothetical protein
MLALAALAALALPAPAVAQQTFATSGSITYTWQGDPARGCAAQSLCGVQGALILQAQGSGGSSSGPSRGSIDIPLEATGSTVRVSDGPGAGDCVDVPSSIQGGGFLTIARGPGGRLVGHLGPSLSSGRCAGPRAQDLAGITLPIRRSRGMYDLRGSESFAAGPFTGTLVSTLVVRTAPNASGSGSAGPSPVANPYPSTHKVLLEQVTLRYRITSLPGTLDASFSGESDPFCATLDSCGATGTLALSFPGFQRTLVLNASRTVQARVGARQAIADLERGRLQAQGGESGPFAGSSTARVAETLSWAGGLSCHDTSDTSRAPLFLSAGPTRSGGGVSLVLNNPVGSDLLRTHCPGPLDTDVFGVFPGLARTSIGLAELLKRHSVISLTKPGSFAGAGYVGGRSGALAFSLTLERVRAGTVEETRL